MYRTSDADHNDVYCVTCHLKNKNVKFIDVIADLEAEGGDNREHISSNFLWDEWEDTFRDVYDWRYQDAGKTYGLYVSDEEITSDAKEEIEDEEESDEVEEYEIIDREYRPCSSVDGKLSPTGKYVAAVCEDVNGVPPSLWLLDLTPQVDESRERSNKDLIGKDQLATSVKVSIDDKLRQSTFGNRNTQSEEEVEAPKESDFNPPLLLHSQSRPR